MASPTFSERRFACTLTESPVECVSDEENQTTNVHKKISNLPQKGKEDVPKPMPKPAPAKPSLAPFDDLVRVHRLPLKMKSSAGDMLQVYLTGPPRFEDSVLVYDVEFDDLTKVEAVHRNALSLPSDTGYRIMMLRNAGGGDQRTPERKRSRRR